MAKSLKVSKILDMEKLTPNCMCGISDLPKSQLCKATRFTGKVWALESDRCPGL